MEIFIWVIIILLFLLSFIGIFVPVIPSVILIWVGFLVYHFAISSEELNAFFWIVMLVFTVILIAADLLMNLYFIDKFGGSKWSQWGAILGFIVGIFLYPPFGMVLAPLVIVIIIEWIQSKDMKKALHASLGTIVGFLSGAVAKIVIQLIMIIWFIITIVL